MPNEQMMLAGQLPASAPPMLPPEMQGEMMGPVPTPAEAEAMMASMPPEMTSGIGSLVNAEEAPMVPEAGIGSLPEMTEQLAAMGREGDIYVVHASEGDTVIPMDVLNANPQLKDMLFAQIGDMGYDPERYIVGNELNSINPDTGLPEFFFKKLFKGLKKVAKIALPIALAYFGPAAWAAMSTAGTAAGAAAAGTAGTAAGLTAGASAAAAGAGSALGTALTGGDLEQIAISGGLGALGSGLGGEAARANTIPFTEAARADAAAKVAASQATAGSLSASPLQNVQGRLGDTVRRPLSSPMIGAGTPTYMGPPVVSQEAAARAAQTITEPTILQRVGAYLNPVRDEAGKKLAMDAAGNLVPTSMSAFRAALPAGVAALGATALMGGGGYGDNPDDIFGDATQEEIDAKRTYLENYPSILPLNYNPVVGPGRPYNRSYESTRPRYARDGGLASLLPVRRMAEGGPVLKMPIGGPVLSPQQKASLTPSQQLDYINDLYRDEYNSTVRGPNPTMSEQDWVNSPRFQEYEDAVVGSTRALSQAGVANQGLLTAPVDESGLEFQRARSIDPNNIYSDSAQRIANAMARVTSGGALTPQQAIDAQNEREMQEAIRRDEELERARNPPIITTEEYDPYGDPNNWETDGVTGIPVFVGPGGSGVPNLRTFPDTTAGGTTAGGTTAGGTTAPPPPPPIGAPPPPLSGGLFADGYQYYEPNPARIRQLQGVQPEVSDAAGLFSKGVQQAADQRQQLQEPVAAKMEHGGRVYGPRRMGRVPGPLGVERDIVPADLMPGEFVFTKDAVQGAGRMAGGGFQQGIKTMHGLMKRFEGVA